MSFYIHNMIENPAVLHELIIIKYHLCLVVEDMIMNDILLSDMTIFIKTNYKLNFGSCLTKYLT
jgi:hypothetical protein